MTKKTKNKSRVAGIFVIVLGLVFTTTGGGFTFFSYTFSQTALATSGVVTDIEVNWTSSSSSGSSSSSPTYQPTISFFDQNGTEQSAQTFLSSSSYNYRIGTNLQILYDPEDPSSMRIDSWFALWGFGLIFFVVGLLTLGGGVVLTFFTNRAKNLPTAPETSANNADRDATRQKNPDYSYSSSDESEKRTPTVRRR